MTLPVTSSLCITAACIN